MTAVLGTQHIKLGNDRKPFRTFAPAGYRSLELFALANNIQANTCSYLSLMRLGGSSITTSLDQQSLSVFDETGPFFYYLVGLTIIIPGLKCGK